MKVKKFLSMGLAAIMAVSAMSISALAAEQSPDDTVIYSYMDENGNDVNITQSELDEEHWNVDALGKIAPKIYEDFPMKITGFANDVAELSLNCVYMKKIDEMDSVKLKITTIDDETVYDTQLTQGFFYTPSLEVGQQYNIILTETVNGNTREYDKIVLVNKEDADLPEYVTAETTDDESIILVADVDILKKGITKDENGNISIDGTIAKYNKIKAYDFNEYCKNLPKNKTYRIFTNSNNIQYSGYISTENGVEIYDLGIDMYNPEDLYSPMPLSLPSGITINDVKQYSEELNLRDAVFQLKEKNNDCKYAAYDVSVPQGYLNSSKTGKFKFTITGTSKICAKIWRDTGNGATLLRTMTSTNNDNSVTMEIDTADYPSIRRIDFYIMIYFSSAVDGYGMINFEPISNYTDDVTGSIYNAYNGESIYSSLNNTEYALTDAWDVDAFCIDYWGTADVVYSITIKNRSLAEQAQLEKGISVNGSSEKYISLWGIYELSAFTIWEETRVYTIPENTDITIYNSINDMDEKAFTIHDAEHAGSLTRSPYQLSFRRL